MENKRLLKIYKKLEKESLDALLVSKEVNVSYLSGFSGSDSVLIISNEKNFLITDSRFTQQARNQTRNFEIITRNFNLFKAIAKAVKLLKIKKLGFESQWLSFKEYELLKNLISPMDFIDTFEFVEKIREIKDQEEIKLIKKAAAIAKEALSQTVKNLKAGQSEIEIAAKIDYIMKLNGAAKAAFDTIVASGPNSSMPHAPISKRKIKPREPVIVDLGACFEGYNSDLTRTVFLDKITDEFKRTYEIVRTAQERAISAIKPSVKKAKIDSLAREYIAKKGFAKAFLHPIGHGIGREIHENPSISQKVSGVLKEGMVFSVEPGIYLPGKGGIRIEDMVLVTKTGCEVLT